MYPDQKDEVVQLYLDDIIPNRFQPREVFDEKALKELAVSIKEHGVIQPIIVRRIGDKYAVAPLISILEDDEEQSVYVKESATFALGLIGDTSAIDPLVAIMEAKQGLWGKFSFLKEKVVEALGRLNLNNDKVLKVLKLSLMDSSSMVRINAIEALMNSDYEEGPELIRKALQDEDAEVQINALIALYNIQGRDILEEVVSLPGYSESLKEQAREMIEEYEM